MRPSGAAFTAALPAIAAGEQMNGAGFWLLKGNVTDVYCFTDVAALLMLVA
jgi:hypothetical protein